MEQPPRNDPPVAGVDYWIVTGDYASDLRETPISYLVLAVVSGVILATMVWLVIGAYPR